MRIGSEIEIVARVGELGVLCIKIGGGNAHRAKLHPFDDTGEAKTADSGVEQRIARRKFLCAAIGAQQAQARDGGPEASGAVMVLAMNVVGDRAPERDKARARRRRQEPAGGYEKLQRLRQRQA